MAEWLRWGAKTLRRLPDTSDTPRPLVATWPEVARSCWLTYRDERHTQRPPPPSGEEIDLLDEVLGWLWLVRPQTCGLLVASAFGLSIVTLARLRSCGDRSIVRRLTAGRHLIADELNKKKMA